jgi:hypothetical protein
MKRDQYEAPNAYTVSQTEGSTRIQFTRADKIKEGMAADTSSMSISTRAIGRQKQPMRSLASSVRPRLSQPLNNWS